MSIVSTSLIRATQSGSRQHVIYGFTDHVGVTHQKYKLVPLSQDTDADMAAMIPGIELELDEAEQSTAIYRVESGEDALTVAQDDVHSTQKKIAKNLIYWMMRERDPYNVILLEPFIIYLRANYTGAQLLNFLDLTPAQGTKLNNRIDYILNNKADLLSAVDNMEDVDG